MDVAGQVDLRHVHTKTDAGRAPDTAAGCTRASARGRTQRGGGGRGGGGGGVVEVVFFYIFRNIFC